MTNKPKNKEQYDYRGIPTPTCPNCGSNWFRMSVFFDEIEYMPTAYGLEDAECRQCGSLITPATPLDREPFPPCTLCQEEEGIYEGFCWNCLPEEDDYLENNGN